MSIKRCGALLTSWATASALLLCTAVLLGAQSDADKRATIESMYRDYKADAFAGVKDIDAVDVKAQVTQSETTNPQEDKTQSTPRVLFVDVREPRERDVSVIAGAVTKEAFEKDRAKYKDRRVVVYCTIGYRSGVYVKKLAEQGVEAANLKGGILAWTHAGGGVQAGAKPARGENQGAPTKRVHVYGRKWNLLPDGFESVW